MVAAEGSSMIKNRQRTEYVQADRAHTASLRLYYGLLGYHAFNTPRLLTVEQHTAFAKWFYYAVVTRSLGPVFS